MLAHLSRFSVKRANITAQKEGRLLSGQPKADVAFLLKHTYKEDTAIKKYHIKCWIMQRKKTTLLAFVA